MEAMSFSDPVVANVFIDQLRIETILLVEDQELALTRDEDSVLQNLTKVILLQPFSEFYPAPSYRTYSLNEQLGRYIQVDTAEVKLQYQKEL